MCLLLITNQVRVLQKPRSAVVVTNCMLLYNSTCTTTLCVEGSIPFPVILTG